MINGVLSKKIAKLATKLQNKKFVDEEKIYRLLVG